MPIKALRLQIIKPYNDVNEENPITWKMLGETLGDLRYAATRMANYVIQQSYQWEFFKNKYKAENGEYPKASDYSDMTYSYPVLTAMFPQVAGQMVNQIERFAKSVWNTRRKEVLSLRQSVPSFKLNFPIIVHNKSYSIMIPPDIDPNKHYGFNYVIKTNLGSKQTGQTNYSLLVDAGERSKQVILERIMDGTYKKGAMQIIGRRTGNQKATKWFCLIPYDFDVDLDEALDMNKVMGVDLGISKAVYWAFSDSLKRGWIEGHEIEEFRRRVRARRIDIQNQGKYCGEGRIGHGRTRRLKPINTLQEKEANFRDTTNHRYAKRVIEAALQQKCGVIQMEDLSGINELSTFLKNWSYFDLQNKIKTKAADAGIQVITVDPKYTSQRCSKCGHIDKESRPNQATFICTNCGYGNLYQCASCGSTQEEAGTCHNCDAITKHVPVNADYNAAKNLSILGIDTIIEEKLGESMTEGGEKTEKVRANRKRTVKHR